MRYMSLEEQQLLAKVGRVRTRLKDALFESNQNQGAVFSEELFVSGYIIMPVLLVLRLQSPCISVQWLSLIIASI